MAEELREYAWKNRTSMSAIVSTICENLITNPRYYSDQSDGGTNIGLSKSMTFYVNDDPWLRAKDVMYFARLPLSVGIREGIRSVLAKKE